MFGLGPKEIIILAVIFVLLFGAKKIPELTRAIGQTGRELRKGFSDDKDENDKDEELAKKIDNKDKNNKDKNNKNKSS